MLTTYFMFLYFNGNLGPPKAGHEITMEKESDPIQSDKYMKVVNSIWERLIYKPICIFPAVCKLKQCSRIKVAFGRPLVGPMTK